MLRITVVINNHDPEVSDNDWLDSVKESVAHLSDTVYVDSK